MKIAKISSKGGRSFNQDYTDYAVAGQYICIAVGDGLGAYSGSEIASEMAVRGVLKWFRKAVKKEENVFTGSAMNKMFKYAHAAVHKIKNTAPELRNSCTTLSVVIVCDNKLIAAHVGDSRIYFFKNNAVHFYSKDHSLARLAADRGEITYADIRTHQDQNKLTRVIGADYFVQPDYKIYDKVESGDSVLICSDGFWEYVYEYDMEEALVKNEGAKEALSAMEDKLNSKAAEGNDNYSAILLRFSGGGVAELGEDNLSALDYDPDFITDEGAISEPDEGAIDHDGLGFAVTNGSVKPDGNSNDNA